ncbi:MAG: 16S rRNA (adenine(1518)-N(6)/adenine(1519)-N(6))-dimethyltransferase, partial [Clostridia bacterium]|nr:16S rRNA (adenine(1518)-N(6)/adenine(1519)-N(6))-dimethyltransferase [Clostridia bacterium]
MQNQSISAGLRARVALEKNGFRTTHSLGQNFILDDDFLNLLLDISGVNADDNVLEIGPGPGVMTCLIADRAKQIVAIEMDEKL